MNRREFTAGAAAAGLALSSSAFRAWGQQSRQLVISATGGSWQESARKAYFEPFAKERQMRVIDVPGASLAKLAAMVAAKKVEWDVMDFPGSQLGTAVTQGLIEKIDYSVVKKDSSVPKDAYGEYSIAYGYYSTNMIYNTDSFKGRTPASWRDFWDQKAFPGPRSLRRAPHFTLEAALLADGVPMEQLYPLDLDRAFRKLDEIKPYVKAWWATGDQSIAFVASGDAHMGVTWNSSVVAARQDNRAVEIVWNQAALSPTLWIVPKGAPNKDAAMEFLNYIVQKEPQVRMALLNKSAPVNTAALAGLDPSILRYFPTVPEHRKGMFILGEVDFWGPRFTAINERFLKWISG